MHKILLPAFSVLLLAQVASAAPTLVFATGGMGSDGASLQPVPTKSSVKQAEAVYNALKVKPAADGSKSVGLEVDGDVIGIQCKEPRTGIHTRTAGCEFITLLREEAPKMEISVTKGNVTFPGEISDLIFRSLNVRTDSRRVGAVVKEAGNLRCTKAVRPGAKPSCTLSDVMVSKMAVEKFPAEQQRELRKLAKRIGL